MNSDHLIFVGFQLTEAVSALLDECSDRDKIYLEDASFLERVTIDDENYVGKRIKDSVAIDRIEDTARSVVSLLTRVSPNWKANPSSALVIAVEETAETAGIEPEEDGEDTPRFDYLGLVD